MASAELKIEEQLWQTADKLRGSMDASEYKNVVLGLIFLKYVSDSFEEKHAELLVDEYADEEDRDEYLAENIFWIPKEARWSYISGQYKSPEIGQIIDHAMIEIEKSNTTLKNVLPKTFARPQLDKIRLGETVDLISNITVGDAEGQKNVAVTLLDRLLRGKVKSIQRTNLMQSKKFSEMLDASINKYNKRTIETPKVIEELIEMAKEMNDAMKRGEDLGLSRDEIAFYDALADHETAKEVLGDDELKAIAHELTKTIKENMSVDWNVKDSTRAQMRVAVRRLLKKYGYPPDLQKMAVERIVEQAELMASGLN